MKLDETLEKIYKLINFDILISEFNRNNISFDTDDEKQLFAIATLSSTKQCDVLTSKVKNFASTLDESFWYDGMQYAVMYNLTYKCLYERLKKVIGYKKIIKFNNLIMKLQLMGIDIIKPVEEKKNKFISSISSNKTVSLKLNNIEYYNEYKYKYEISIRYDKKFKIPDKYLIDNYQLKLWYNLNNEEIDMCADEVKEDIKNNKVSESQLFNALEFFISYCTCSKKDNSLYMSYETLITYFSLFISILNYLKEKNIFTEITKKYEYYRNFIIEILASNSLNYNCIKTFFSYLELSDKRIAELCDFLNL